MGFYIVNHEGFPPRSKLIHTTYSLSFPTCLSHPRKCAPSLLNNPSATPLPFQGFSNRPDKNSQRTIATDRLPLGEITSPTTPLTWREFLIGLTTCFFSPASNSIQVRRWKQQRSVTEHTMVASHTESRSHVDCNHQNNFLAILVIYYF
jgi:hypothetical protein